jgi:glycine cleavage system aminomethyltransferase T
VLLFFRESYFIARALTSVELLTQAIHQSAWFNGFHQILRGPRTQRLLDIAGRVTSVASSPTLGKTIGLAMATPALSAPGTAISIRMRDGALLPATVVRTPFVEHT